MLHQIKAQQFYNDLGLYQLWQVLQKIVEFKDFPRFLSDFPVPFKDDLNFKDFSWKPSKVQALIKPVRTLVEQTLLTLIPMEQSDLRPYCLQWPQYKNRQESRQQKLYEDFLGCAN